MIPRRLDHYVDPEEAPRRGDPSTDPDEEPAEEPLAKPPPGVQAEVFDFEGGKVVAWFDKGKWSLHSRGCSAVGAHLGSTSRILFNPSFHGDTRPLVEAILAWHAKEEASAA